MPRSPRKSDLPLNNINPNNDNQTPQKAYSSNLVDYHLALDLVPPLAAAYLAGRVPATLSYGQAAILLTLGLGSARCRSAAPPARASTRSSRRRRPRCRPACARSLTPPSSRSTP